MCALCVTIVSSSVRYTLNIHYTLYTHARTHARTHAHTHTNKDGYFEASPHSLHAVCVDIGECVCSVCVLCYVVNRCSLCCIHTDKAAVSCWHPSSLTGEIAEY